MKIIFSLVLPVFLYVICQKYALRKSVSVYLAAEFTVLVFLLNYFVVIVLNHNPDVLANLSASPLYSIKCIALLIVISGLVLLIETALNKVQDSKLRAFSDYKLFLEALLCGAAIFTTIYGIRVLNPLYTDWLMSGGDLTQHYLGWCSFRNSAWQFPIGLHNGLSYPYHVSIIYTDSIPLFAVFFKLISFLLPDKFQYFGLWGIMCFSLQCMLGTVICKKYTNKNILALLGGALLTISPVMIWRMFGHTALAGHWIILLSWLPVIYTDKFETKKRSYGFWLVMGILCCSIHMYFIVLCGMSLCAYILKRCIKEKNFYSLLSVIPYVGGGVLTIWLLGGFSVLQNYAAGGLGVYGSNLNTYFNTQGHAIFLANARYYGKGQYEGFGYLGVGVLILSIISLVVAMQEFLDSSTLSRKNRIILNATPYIFILLSSTALAIIPNITYNEGLIFKIPLPGLLTSFMNVFRANGRFIWGGVYAISIASLAVLLKKYKANMAFIILIVCVTLQLCDLSKWLSGKYNSFSKEKHYQSLLKDERWEQISDMNFTHVYISGNIASGKSRPKMYSIAKWAIENDMTMNRFYFARGIKGISGVWADKIKNSGSADIVIFDVNDYSDYSGMKNLYILDGFIIGATTEIPGLESYDSKQYVMDAKVLKGNNNVEIKKDGKMICRKDGVIYGPYITVPEGNYRITYMGDKLQECTFDCVSSQGAVHIKTTVVAVTPDKIIYDISLGKRTEKVEFRLFNKKDSDAVLRQVKLEGLHE